MLDKLITWRLALRVPYLVLRRVRLGVEHVVQLPWLAVAVGSSVPRPDHLPAEGETGGPAGGGRLPRLLHHLAALATIYKHFAIDGQTYFRSDVDQPFWETSLGCSDLFVLALGHVQQYLKAMMLAPP